MGVTQDLDLAYVFYLRGCVGNSGRCYRHGMNYATGRDGTDEDDDRAAEFFAHVRGALRFELGDRYSQGDEVPIDLERALGFYEAACASEAPVPCERAGLAYLEGDGTETDHVRGHAMLLRACEINPLSCEGYAARFVAGATGDDIMDSGYAGQFYAVACTAGVSSACAELEALNSSAVVALP